MNTVNDKKKLFIILGVVIVLIIAAIVAIIIINGKDEKKGNDEAKNEQTEVANDSAAIIEDGTYKGLTIDNIILMAGEDQSTFTATVTNSTENAIDVEGFGIVLKKGDNEVTTLYGYLGDAMQAGESREITASVGMKLSKDVVDSVSYEDYELKKGE